ncbi:hypothetical protein ACF061_06415 [Streptomyces sp. NPDC015220]|uniref:hypothetical protein n=1 Tax=Streptomyces sp. NPDC015220 TaxID=3364947 RepID=UPI0036F8E4D7
MSRETDTPSSGPNGRGGAAYPSGTPPYGIPAVSDDGADAGRSATQPEERKTETTLTTRIRINIPGSRPIPPVVVRKPVADGETENGNGTRGGGESGPGPEASRGNNGSHGAGRANGAKGSRGPQGSDAVGSIGDGIRGDMTTPGAAAETPAAEPAAPAEEKPTSDWFAPRKPQAAKGGQGGGTGNGAALPGGSGTPANGSGANPGGAGAGVPGTGPAGSGASGTGPSGGARPGAGARPGGVVGSMSVPGASRSGSTNGAGLPGATGGPVAPGHGGGTGSFDVTEALAAGPLSGGNGEPRRDDLPFFSENGQGGQSGHGSRNDRTGSNGQGGYGQGGYGGQGGQGGRSVPGAPGAQGGANGTAVPGGTNGAGVPGGPGGSNGPGGQRGPAGPTGGPVTGDGALFPSATGGSAAGPAGVAGAHTARPGGGLSDDTAILTPQKPAPEPGGAGYPGRPDNVSGQTVTSGMPVVQPGPDSPFRPGAGGDGSLSSAPPKAPAPGPQSPAAAGKPAKAAKAPKKKGRSKLVLLVGGLVLVAGVAYGAGLLMNHSDVPKGTTVLGVDIGGGTRDDAVKKLDDAFGKRVNQPLKLSVDGKTVSLKPDQAGLQLDTQATASAAATSDYNPVSVIGSLFGNHRVVEPQMPVDEEKLQAALQNAAGGAGSNDGTVKFEPGKAVAVYGKAGKGIDAARSSQAVAQAYRTQVETGATTPVQVPTTTRQPTVSNAEVDRMMQKFAEPAMSDKVTVQTDPAHSIPMSPQKSLWKFLRVAAVNGKLVDKPDLAALKDLYGQTFDGVLIARGNGQKTPVTPEDVYSALRQALMSKTNRVAVIDTNPS